MGYRSIYGIDPLRAAHLAVTDPAEKMRRRLAQERVDLFYENTDAILLEEAGRLFKNPDVKSRLTPFLKLAASPSLFPRTIKEVAGPVYQVPPVRKVMKGGSREPDKEQTKRLRTLAERVGLDCVMDLAVHLGMACNDLFLLFRQDEDLGVIVDVVTPAQSTVLPHPADTRRELGFIYDRQIMVDGRPETVYAYIDDEEAFLFNKNGARLGMGKDNLWRMETGGVFPVVPIHMTERTCGQYWDINSGNALKKTSIAASLITALTLKLHKSAGFKQIVVAGDIVAFPKGQTFDEEHGVLAPEGTNISTLDLTTPASHYLETLEDLVKRMAANYGINLDRLNAATTANTNDVGLQERREDAIKIFRRVEERAFDLLKVFSKYDRENRLDDDGILKVDYGELTLRTDPMGTLELWEKQISKGLRNELDNIRAMNPEVDSDEEAWEEFERNLTIHAEAIQRMRALNMTQDGSPDMPGQDAAANGALGPMTRDGKITKDQAAEAAKGQNKPDLRSIAKKALYGA